MAEGRPSGVVTRGQRCWSFANCVFDEANWSLIVAGNRTSVERKPLEILRELLLRAGQVVSKEELLDAIWPNVTVVEASLPTAVRKLRMALGDSDHDHMIIETVSGIGYRMAVPVNFGTPDDGVNESTAAPAGFRASGPRPRPRQRMYAAAIGALAIAVALALGLGNPERVTLTTPTAPAFPQAEIYTALRKVDLAAIEKLLAAGWDPNAALDVDHNGAINVLLNNCEWDRGHDQRKMLLATRTLIDGGARVENRNVWGDTSYSIAKADRYCGPNHPVTKMMRMICYEGGNPIGDRCLADYKRDAAGKVVRQY